MITNPEAKIRTFARGNKVVAVGEYNPDPAGRGDYEWAMTLSPDMARWLASELLKLAEQIDQKQARAAMAAEVRRHTEEIAKRAKAELDR